MPGMEATAAAALLFWALMAQELFWWGGISTFQACRVLICLGWGVCSFSRPCSASLGRFSARSSVLYVVCASALHLYGTAVFLCFPFLEGSTPSLSYMICPDLVQCVSSPLGKPLFVLKQLFAFSLSGSFLSAHPPPHGGGCWDWMGFGRGIWGGLHGACLWQVVLLHRAALGGSRGFRRPCVYDPPPPTP